MAQYLLQGQLRDYFKENAMRIYGAAFLGIALMVGPVGQAFATITCQSESPPGTLSPDYTCLNGATTLPGTNVGTVGFISGDVDEIGNISLYNSGSGGAFVNSGNNPSIYEFTWGGGALDITEEIGNNGTALNGIDVELGLAASNSLNSDESLSSEIASIHIPYSSGPSGFYTVYDASLAAGTYVLDTYLAGSDVGDPNYQTDFAAGTASVPEPASLAVLGASLVSFSAMRRRRRKSRQQKTQICS